MNTPSNLSTFLRSLNPKHATIGGGLMWLAKNPQKMADGKELHAILSVVCQNQWAQKHFGGVFEMLEGLCTEIPNIRLGVASHVLGQAHDYAYFDSEGGQQAWQECMRWVESYTPQSTKDLSITPAQYTTAVLLTYIREVMRRGASSTKHHPIWSMLVPYTLQPSVADLVLSECATATGPDIAAWNNHPWMCAAAQRISAISPYTRDELLDSAGYRAVVASEKNCTTPYAVLDALLAHCSWDDVMNGDPTWRQVLHSGECDEKWSDSTQWNFVWGKNTSPEKHCVVLDAFAMRHQHVHGTPPPVHDYIGLRQLARLYPNQCPFITAAICRHDLNEEIEHPPTAALPARRI